MATTTPSFSWPVPTSSDLVKNGATAIEALGDAIDASMTDLKGGTTGQVLAKATNTDMDFTWTTPSSGSAAFVGAYAYRTTDLTIAAATDTIVTLPLEDFDTDAFHSTSTNTGRITIPTGKAGKYQFNAYAFLSTSPGAYARFRIYKNGSSVGLGLKDGTLQGIDGFGYLAAQGSIVLNLAVSDYVEIGFLSQNSCTCAFAYLSAQFLGA
jgi:hypothetical protein